MKWRTEDYKFQSALHQNNTDFFMWLILFECDWIHLILLLFYYSVHLSFATNIELYSFSIHFSHQKIKAIAMWNQIMSQHRNPISSQHVFTQLENGTLEKWKCYWWSCQYEFKCGNHVGWNIKSHSHVMRDIFKEAKCR